MLTDIQLADAIAGMDGEFAAMGRRFAEEYVNEFGYAPTISGDLFVFRRYADLREQQLIDLLARHGIEHDCIARPWLVASSAGTKAIRAAAQEYFESLDGPVVRARRIEQVIINGSSAPRIKVHQHGRHENAKITIKVRVRNNYLEDFDLVLDAGMFPAGADPAIVAVSAFLDAFVPTASYKRMWKKTIKRLSDYIAVA